MVKTSGESSSAALSYRSPARFQVSQGGLSCDKRCDLSFVCMVCGNHAEHADRRKVSFGPRLNPVLFMTGPLVWLIWAIYAHAKTNRSELTVGYCTRHFRARKVARAAAVITGAATVALLASLGRIDGSASAAGLAVAFMGLMVAVGYVTSEFSVAGVDARGTITLTGVEPRVVHVLVRSQETVARD